MTTPLVSFTFYTDQVDNFSNYQPNIPFVCHSSLNLHFVGTN